MKIESSLISKQSPSPSALPANSETRKKNVTLLAEAISENLSKFDEDTRDVMRNAVYEEAAIFKKNISNHKMIYVAAIISRKNEILSMKSKYEGKSKRIK